MLVTDVDVPAEVVTLVVLVEELVVVVDDFVVVVTANMVTEIVGDIPMLFSLSKATAYI